LRLPPARSSASDLPTATVRLAQFLARKAVAAPYAGSAHDRFCRFEGNVCAHKIPLKTPPLAELIASSAPPATPIRVPFAERWANSATTLLVDADVLVVQPKQLSTAPESLLLQCALIAIGRALGE
jgi:hypothetical protein